MPTTQMHLCPGCFQDVQGANPCPACGYDKQASRSPLVLPHHTLLHDQLVVGRLLGKPGGFGIAYLAWDIRLETRVVIKEFLPRDLAARESDQTTVVPHSAEDGELFRFGLEKFLHEARTLARLDHPNIVRVRQFFQANDTAYLVMDYYQGQPLSAFLDSVGGRLPENQAIDLMLPVLDGLRAVHAKGFLHRDIKPDNIYLANLETGGVRPILIDFGAARQAIGERSRSLSVVLTEGYAPFEQYHRKGKQGPWTDIYAAGAVIYRMLTGSRPPPAPERMEGDELVSPCELGVSAPVSDLVLEALALRAKDRYQNVGELLAALSVPAAGSDPVPAIQSPGGAAVHAPPPRPPKPQRSSRRSTVIVPSALVLLAAIGGGLGY